jgi:hypothetical protein
MPVLLLHVRANALLIVGVVCAVLAAAFPAIAQPDEATGDEDGPVARVVAALEAGDADALLTEAGERIEIVLFERGGLFSRGQAELVLGGFFRRHPAERVVLAEQSLTDEERAAMGRYFTRSGEAPLRVYVRFRPNGEEWSLDAVRIERATVLTSSGGTP